MKIPSIILETAQLAYNWMFPHYCCLCGAQAEQDRELCLACERELPWLGPCCPQCGLQYALASDQHCPSCLKRSPPYQNLIALFDYCSPVTVLLNRFKFHSELRFQKLFANLLAEKIAGLELDKRIIDADCICAVPLHPARFIERGFNQSAEIAKLLSVLLNKPYIEPFEKIKQTPPQSSLSGKARENNLRGAFKLKNPINYASVAIVDDVVTTGSTVSELAKLLHQAQVKNVQIWSVCKTQLGERF